MQPGDLLSDTARNRTLLISAESAHALLAFLRTQQIPGELVTRLAPVMMQLETFEPRRAPPASSSTA
jgi:hypothetical protein